MDILLFIIMLYHIIVDIFLLFRFPVVGVLGRLY